MRGVVSTLQTADELDRSCRGCGLGAVLFGFDMASVRKDDREQEPECGLYPCAGSALLVVTLGESNSNSPHNLAPTMPWPWPHPYHQ